MRFTPTASLAAVLASPLAVAAAPLPLCPIQPGQTVRYEIIRNGGVMGHQTYHFDQSGPDLTVTVDIAASLSALGVRVYNYQHHGVEHWRDGQMVALDTKTDDDGTPRQVHAFKDASGWHGTTGMDPGAAPLLSTSMWNSQTVTQTRLLDRETGAVVAVRVTPMGNDTVTVAGRATPVQKYGTSGIVVGDAWYAANGCWVRAVFKTRVDGSMVEVREQ